MKIHAISQIEKMQMYCLLPVCSEQCAFFWKMRLEQRCQREDMRKLRGLSTNVFDFEIHSFCRLFCERLEKNCWSLRLASIQRSMDRPRFEDRYFTYVTSVMPPGTTIEDHPLEFFIFFFNFWETSEGSFSSVSRPINGFLAKNAHFEERLELRMICTFLHRSIKHWSGARMYISCGAPNVPKTS